MLFITYRKECDLAQHYHLRGRFWIESPQGTFLGQGRVLLLERVQELGSISAAARSMKMSYRQAWGLISQMNSHSPEPLVLSSTGGQGGGGAQLTHVGKRAIQLYHEVLIDFEAFLSQRAQTLKL